MTVTVRMKPSEYEKLRRAANEIWPGAIITDAAIVLGLALRGAEATKREHPRSKRD